MRISIYFIEVFSNSFASSFFSRLTDSTFFFLLRAERGCESFFRVRDLRWFFGTVRVYYKMFLLDLHGWIFYFPNKNESAAYLENTSNQNNRSLTIKIYIFALESVEAYFHEWDDGGFGLVEIILLLIWLALFRFWACGELEEGFGPHKFTIIE